jgi:PKD repeat protein
LFNRTNNIGSGRTISTNKVWPGGTTGTALTGSGMTSRLGEWDAGGILVAHQEFGGRVTQVDGASPTNTHSTHVAGTMIAAGVSANAVGMAYQAPLKAYDWNNDVSEMSSAAGAGMLLSNHSYGTICGWYYNSSLGREEWYGDASISTIIDYKYGFYDQAAADWDNVARSYPNYLICKAAGNDRGQSYSGTHYVRDASGTWVSSTATRNAVGPYDCMEPTATAKNILTVGAVNKIGSSNSNNGWTQISDVVMSTFSGWGPTDDGRIKPDVVAAGVNIFSTSDAGTTSYTTMSGTSMATPAACGSLLLVQQHYNNLKGKFMRAATLKGLAIHTADEAGNIGPDYTYGWGLLNTSKAVKHITDSMYNLVLEKTLANGGTFTQAISSDGVTPLRITISWTDVPATPLSPALNDTTRRLVNDLDIRLKRNSDNTVFMPYVLSPASPSSAATTGDNNKDNVEQIYLSAPVAGTYTLTVSHKGTLQSAPQAYSLLVSGVAGPPAASFTKSVTAVCTGQTVTYTDNSSGSPTIRKWYFPGGTPATATASSVAVTYNTPGTYAVALKVTNTLGSDSTYAMNTINVGGLKLPFYETFESNSSSLNLWSINNPGADTTWRLATVSGLSTGTRAYCMPFYNYTSTGQRDGLISPILNFAGVTNAKLYFKHAYTRRNTTSTDSLVVYISTNCGSTWTRLLSKGENGTRLLATAPDSTLASANIFYPSQAADWCGSNAFGASCNALDLSAYNGMNNIRVKFEGYNNHGNNLFIDSVFISGTFAKPIPNFTVSKTTACTGELVNFADSSLNVVTNWHWTFAGASVSSSGLQNPTSISYAVPGVYTVKLVVSNPGGSDSITKTNYITVLASPGVPTISSSRNLSLCSGDSVILTSDSTGAGYQWLNSGQVITGATARALTVNATGSYQVKVFNANGCGSVSQSAGVTVNPPVPQPSFSSTITGSVFCTGGMAVLTSNAPAGNHWYKNSIANSADTNTTYSTPDSGTYTLKVVLNGCSSPMSAPVTYGLLPKPAALTITGNTVSHYYNTDTFSVQARAGSTYAWNITGGTQMSGSNTNTITAQWAFVSNGVVSVRETGSNGCKGDAVNQLVTLTPNLGINETSAFSYFNVYPNPAKSVVTIDMESPVKQLVEISLLNILGQKVYGETVTMSDRLSKAIDLSALSKGMYILSVTGEKGNRQLKLLVE